MFALSSNEIQGNSNLQIKIELLSNKNGASYKINGDIISSFTGHRFKPLYDFGFVVLDIKYVFPEDSGTYTCKASNQYGQDEISCVVKVKGKYH